MENQYHAARALSLKSNKRTYCSTTWDKVWDPSWAAEDVPWADDVPCADDVLWADDVPFCNTRTEFIQNLNRWGIDITVHKHNPAGMHTHTHTHSRTNLHLLIYWCRLLQYHRILRTSPNIDSHQTAGRANSTIPAFVTVYLCGLSEFLNTQKLQCTHR